VFLQILRKSGYLFILAFSRYYVRLKKSKFKLVNEELTLRNVKRLLILVPHFDDEVLGCFNLLRNCSSKEFDLMYITDSSGASGKQYDSMTRRLESDKALSKISTIRQKFYLDIPDQEVYKYRAELRNEILLVANDYDFIFSPAPWDTTFDHSSIANVLLEAVDSDKIIYYRSTDYTFKSVSASFCSRGRIGDKLNALKAFKTQRHLALFNPVIYSSYEDRKSRNIETIECFIFANLVKKTTKQNFNTLGIQNFFRFENFTNK
jgi:LmbE family N-acetylglucosaminyl deacetylase